MFGTLSITYWMLVVSGIIGLNVCKLKDAICKEMEMVQQDGPKKKRAFISTVSHRVT